MKRFRIIMNHKYICAVGYTFTPEISLHCLEPQSGRLSHEGEGDASVTPSLGDCLVFLDLDAALTCPDKSWDNLCDTCDTAGGRQTGES